MNGNYLINNVIYKATVKEEDNNNEKVYIDTNDMNRKN